MRAKAERGTGDEGEGLIIFLKAKKREGEKLAAITGCLMSNKNFMHLSVGHLLSICHVPGSQTLMESRETAGLSCGARRLSQGQNLLNKVNQVADQFLVHSSSTLFLSSSVSLSINPSKQK